MEKIFFGDFREHVDKHLEEIKKSEVESYSIEWFFMRYLRRILKITEDHTIDSADIKHVMRALVSFYVHNIEEDSKLAERFHKIYQKYQKTLDAKRHQIRS